MCARDDTVVVPLDATIECGPDAYTNKTEWMSGVNFAYGLVHTTATCLSLNDIREIEGSSNISTPPNMLSTSDERLLGRSGWYNGDETNPENERKNCYVQLTHPMLSMWVLHSKSASKQTCYDDCLLKSKQYTLCGKDPRINLFNAILPE
jgi:hypothetical protein